MLCEIYKSLKCDQTYLYIEKKDDFSQIPLALLESFGTPRWVMTLCLNRRKTLAATEPDMVKSSIKQKGYYLQLPPTIENLSKSHHSLN